MARAKTPRQKLNSMNKEELKSELAYHRKNESALLQKVDQLSTEIGKLKEIIEEIRKEKKQI